MGDADITLRHLLRRHAEALARPYLPAGLPVEIVGWADTQVTALERRLDKTLLLRLAGELHALQIEFEHRYKPDLPERVHAYRSLTRMAMCAEQPGRRPPPMESVVVLLTGRRKPWRAERALRTGWRNRRFSGIRFQIDAIYQRSVAELHARGSAFWLAFSPLARDADAAAMREVVAVLRSSTAADEDRWELFAALLVMADVDPWGHNLREEIERMIDEEPNELIRVSKTLRDAYDQGERAGLEKGREEGREEGREKGIEEGIEKMLRGLFARRLHRALTARERRALARHAARDPEQVQESALALEGEALAAWLLRENGTGRVAGAAPRPQASATEKGARG